MRYYRYILKFKQKFIILRPYQKLYHCFVNDACDKKHVLYQSNFKWINTKLIEYLKQEPNLTKLLLQYPLCSFEKFCINYSELFYKFSLIRGLIILELFPYLKEQFSMETTTLNIIAFRDEFLVQFFNVLLISVNLNSLDEPCLSDSKLMFNITHLLTYLIDRYAKNILTPDSELHIEEFREKKRKLWTTYLLKNCTRLLLRFGLCIEVHDYGTAKYEINTVNFELLTKQINSIPQDLQLESYQANFSYKKRYYANGLKRVSYIFLKDLNIQIKLNTSYLKHPPSLSYQTKDLVYSAKELYFLYFRYSVGNVRYKLIEFNRQNSYITSELSFDLSVLQAMSSIAYQYSVCLYKEIQNLFLLKAYLDPNEYAKNKALLVNLEFMCSNSLKSTLDYYLPTFFDFRGRIYSRSVFSIIDEKMFRYILKPIEGESIHYNSKFSKFFNNYNFLLKKVINSLPLSLDSEIMLIAFYCIGKCLKHNLKAADLLLVKISLESMIQLGITFYNEIKISCSNDCITFQNQDSLKVLISLYEKYSVKNLNNRAELKTYIIKLERYIYYNESFTIIADSTASGLVHFNLWGHCKSKYLPYFNLIENEHWYDPYSWICNTLLENWPELTLDEKLLFTRARVKKIFMTLPYNATNWSLREYFFSDMTLAEKELGTPLFNSFVRRVRNIMYDIYILPLDKIYKHTKISDTFTVNINNCCYDYKYYNLKRSPIGVKPRSRDLSNYVSQSQYRTYQMICTPEIDTQKQKTALCANIIHTTDSIFLKNVYLQCYQQGIHIYTVHDEFIVPAKHYLYFLEICNKTYNELFFTINGKKSNYSSFFIVL